MHFPDLRAAPFVLFLKTSNAYVAEWLLALINWTLQLISLDANATSSDHPQGVEQEHRVVELEILQLLISNQMTRLLKGLEQEKK